MKIFSKHRKKLEPKKRFGGMEFRSKVKIASNYKRVFSINSPWRTLKITGFFTVIILVVAFYFFGITSKFTVTNVSVLGNSQVSANDVRNAILALGNDRTFFVKENNFFLLTQGRVNQIVTQALPLVKSTSSKRTWPNKISIEISERMPGFVIESNNRYFLIDQDGIVFNEIDSPGDKLILHDQLTEDFAQNEQLSNSKIAAFILSINKEWNSKINTSVLSMLFAGKNSTDVQFQTQEGWSVMFDASRPALGQLNNLTLILNQAVASKDRPNLAYIDLRITKWAYVCYKATPCYQTPQPGQDAGATTTNTPTTSTTAPAAANTTNNTTKPNSKP
jgi:cell division septal protein FtsQ